MDIVKSTLNEGWYFVFSYFSQKNKRQSAYDGIRYDKLGTSGDINNASKSPPQPKSTKVLISADDIELNREKLQQAFEEAHDDDVDDDDEEGEETRFINNSKRSSFYTSSERTWSTINSQIIL